MKPSVCFLLCLLPLLGIGQGQNLQFMKESNAFLQDVNGHPLMLRSEYAIEGSPFFHSEYCTAELKVRNGRSYSGIKVKLNLQENLVIYDAGDGKEMVSVTPIERILFTDCNDVSKNTILQSGFPAVDAQTTNSFYQLLDSGRLQLLKHIGINYKDIKYYGSNQTTRVFTQKETYYVYSPEKGMRKIAVKDNNSVIALLGDHKQELAAYVSSNDLRCKKEEDLLKLVRYYNGLAR